MKKAVLVARLLLGAALVVFGLNGFMGFFEPPPSTPAGQKFLGALFESGYLFPLKDAVTIAAGVFILTGMFLPLGLTLFAPILVNILAFHFVLEGPLTAGMAVLMLVLELFLVWAYLPAFKGVLSARPRSRFAD
jgi:putative oxidoreductase